MAENKENAPVVAADNTAVLAENKSLKAENTALKAENQALKADKAALQTENSEQIEINKDLQAQLEKASTTAEKAAGSIVVTHNKESYKVAVASFKFQGKEYKAEALKSDKALVKALIEKGVGFLVKL